MAFPKENIDLFELTDTVLKEINKQGGVSLNHTDLSFHFSRDANKIDKRLNFCLFVFEEELGVMTYDKKHPTVKKMLQSFYKSLEVEYFYKNIHEALVLTKIKSLKNRLFDTRKAIQDKVLSAFQTDDKVGLFVDIIEDSNKKGCQSNGLPYFVINISWKKHGLNINLPLDKESSDWETGKILQKLETELAP